MIAEEETQRAPQQICYDIADLKHLVRQQTLHDLATNTAYQEARYASEQQGCIAPKTTCARRLVYVPNHVEHGGGQEEANKVQDLVVDPNPRLTARMEAQDAEKDEIKDVEQHKGGSNPKR